MVEQGPYKAEVVGSSPTVPIRAISSPVVQMLRPVRKLVSQTVITYKIEKKNNGNFLMGLRIWLRGEQW